MELVPKWEFPIPVLGMPTIFHRWSKRHMEGPPRVLTIRNESFVEGKGFRRDPNNHIDD
jgi:hypothetical protein